MDSNIIKSKILIEKLNHKSVNDFIIKGLNENSDENIIIDCALERKWTRRQVLDSCLNFAYYLINDCKLSKGDVVCFVGHNSDICVMGFLGVLLAGGVYTSLPIPSPEYEMKKFVKCLKPTLIVCDLKHYGVIKMAQPESKNILLIEHEQTLPTVRCIETILKNRSQASIAVPVATDPEDTVILLSSSGSTGVPKVVIKTNANLLATIAVTCADAHQRAIGADVSMAGPRINHHTIDRIFNAIVMPGAQLAILRTATNAAMYEHIHRYGVTSLCLPPPLMKSFLEYCSTRDKNHVNSLRNVQMAGASIPVLTYEYIVNNFAFEYVINDYGLTETGKVTSVYIRNGSKLTTIGKPVPNTEIKIIDEEDQALPANTKGEICIRSQQVTSGYMNNSREENARLFTSDGFFRTGDLGYYDDEHDIYIVDRIKQLINVISKLVAPVELENILLTHSDVAMAAVIGIPSDEFGEVPLAFVTLIKGATVTVLELIEYVNSKVTNHKHLKGGLRVLDAFPMTHTDKIDKKALKELVEKFIEKN